jgi:hypothetical protein
LLAANRWESGRRAVLSARAPRVRRFGGAATGPQGFFSAEKSLLLFIFRRYFQAAARNAATAHQST